MAGQENVFQQAMNQGHSAAWDQEWDKAADFYRQAVDKKPDNPQAVTSLGLALFELQKFNESQACYTHAATLSPSDPLPIERLAEIFERVGKIQLAVDQAMMAADLYLKIKDADKAIENWARVTRLLPENLKAHSRLAVVYERMGRKEQAIQEFISVAALLQDAGQIGEALQAMERALQIDPENEQGQQAFELVKANKTLPKPRRQRGGTGALRMAAVRETENIQDEIPDLDIEGPDPFGDARQKAMTALAGLLFDVSSDDIDKDGSTVRGLGGVFGNKEELDLSKISIHLGLAIDFQTRAEEGEAVKELTKAISAGLHFPAAFFNLGLLYYKDEQNEEAVKNLLRAVKHPDYALGARLMIADINNQNGRLKEAVEEYLEALKEADSAVIQPDLRDSLREQYEPLIETLPQQEDEEELQQLCQNIVDLLVRPNWRKHLTEVRKQLPKTTTGSVPMPLAEIITEASDTDIVESIAIINQYARDGFLGSAMEEAFIVIDKGPTYLPLHIQMGELLLRQNRNQDAITKFTLVAETYAARGEARRATDLLRRIVETSPMDMGARNRLINRLTDQGQVNQAIVEFINLADVYYRLAQLDMARSTYENALRLAQQNNAERSWSVRVLKHMADIDIQRLDWRNAMRVYEQLRTLAPDDVEARKSLIEMLVRMGQENQAAIELENYISYLSGNAKDNEALAFLENLIAENEDMVFAHRRLAELYLQASRTKDSITQWDRVAEILVERGDNEEAKEAVRAILVLNPSNADQYRLLLKKLG